MVPAVRPFGTVPLIRVEVQLPAAKFTTVDATTALVVASRKSTEQPAVGADRLPKLFPSIMNRLPAVPLPEVPPLIAVTVGGGVGTSPPPPPPPQPCITIETTQMENNATKHRQ